MQEKTTISQRLNRVAVAASVALATSPTFAAVDVSGAETAISDSIPAVTSLGTAVLGVLVVAAVFKWVRRVF